MIQLLINNEVPKSKDLIGERLETPGFDIVSLENGHVFIKRKLTNNTNIGKPPEPVTTQSIFPSNPRLIQVFEFIESNYHQNISLKEVAQAVGYSSAYLTHLVRRLTGKTVTKWIIERRLVEAKHLLLEADESVEKIALKVGYQSVNLFYRQFREHHNLSPRAWREAQHLNAS